MPWKLIFFLVLMGLVVFFAGFNLDNSSDVSFGFRTFEDVPIFLSLAIAFFGGAAVTLPFSFRKYLSKRARPPKLKKENKRKGKGPHAPTDGSLPTLPH